MSNLGAQPLVTRGSLAPRAWRSWRSWLMVIGTITVSPDTIQQAQFDIKVRQKKQTNQRNPNLPRRVVLRAMDEAHEPAATDTKHQAMKNLQHRKRLERQVFHNLMLYLDRRHRLDRTELRDRKGLKDRPRIGPEDEGDYIRRCAGRTPRSPGSCQCDSM